MINRISCEEIERYISLNHMQAGEDPYLLRTEGKAFLRENRVLIENGKMRICVLTDNRGTDIGYALLTRIGKGLFAEEIYVIKEYRSLENYMELLNHIIGVHKAEKSTTTRFIGLLNRDSLTEALQTAGFKLEKEHIQMELPIDSPDAHGETGILALRPFAEEGGYLAVYEYMKECLVGSANNYTAEEVKERIEDEKGFAYKIYMGNEPVGFCISFINGQRNRQENKKVLYIEQIAIHIQYRGRGYGQQAMKALIGLAREKGCDTVRLHVYRDNRAAYGLYKKLGFTSIKSIGHWAYYD